MAQSLRVPRELQIATSRSISLQKPYANARLHTGSGDLFSIGKPHLSHFAAAPIFPKQEVSGTGEFAERACRVSHYVVGIWRIVNSYD